MDAVEQLNIKNKNWKDLITDEPFERKDIIVLQDPQNLNKFNISKFHHVKENLRVETEGRINFYVPFLYVYIKINIEEIILNF